MDLKWKLVFRFRLFIAGRGVVGNSAVFVDAEKARVGADKSLIEDTTGQLVEMFTFQRFQMAPRNLGRFGNFIQGDAAHLSFAPQPIPKNTHGSAHTLSWQISQVTHDFPEPQVSASYQNTP